MTTLDEYLRQVDGLIARGDREAAVALSDLSREIRGIAWNVAVVGHRPRELAARADAAAHAIAGIVRQARWTARTASGAYYTVA
jgi:hypothetical protein